MEEDTQNPITPQEFSQKVKAKYPQYANVDDITLAKKMIKKFPEYANQVNFDSNVKKKGSSVSNIPQQQKTGTTASPVADGSSVTPAPIKEEDEEEDYFTGSFGNVLRGFDNIVPLGIGDFVDDMARSVSSGYRQGNVAEAADRLLLKGHKATPEQLQKFIDANKEAQQIKPSAEMRNYTKIYEEEGKGFWGVIKGLASNPSIIPEVMASSLTSMATNTDALKAGGTAIGAGATYGAATGAGAGTVALPLIGTVGGAGAGAIAGAASAIPYAFGLASTVVETGATFGELLTEELKGEDMTKENVKAILEDPEKLQSIRNKAIARGIIIGTIDALTGKLASGVGAKILTKSAAKSAAGAATKAAVVKSTAIGSGIEIGGGSFGEAAARVAIGQEMDVSEIALEGLAELPGGVRSTIQARLAKPSYKINGENIDVQEFDEIINTMTPEQLASTKIDIKNDYQGRDFKIRDKILTNSVKEQVKKANPDLNEPSLNAITVLEKELQNLEGNKTQTGRDKASLLKNKIKDIQENQLVEEVDIQTTEVLKAPEEVAARTERITELENTLSPEAETQVPALEKIELEKELETLKKEEDAVQEQSTTEIPVQSETGVSETMEEGKPESKPEVITEQGTQEKVAEPMQEISLEGIKEENGIYKGNLKQLIVINTNDLTPLNDDEEMIAWQSKEDSKKENNLTDEEWAQSVLDVPTIEDPIDATLKPNGEVIVTDGHHRLLASKILGKDLAVNLKVENYKNEEGKPNISEYLKQISSETNPIETKVEITPIVEEVAPTEVAPTEIKAEAAEVKIVGTNPITSIDIVDDYNAMTEQYRNKNKALTLSFRDNKMTNKEVNALKIQLKNNLKEATKISQESKAKPTEVKAEVAPSEVDALLDLDTKDKTKLKKVLKYLDSLDDTLNLNPNELNDVTRVMAIATAKLVVKALKVLVNTGITLQEAIKQVAADNNIKVSDVTKGIKALSEIAKIPTGYNDLMAKADKLIARQKSKGVTQKKIVSNLDKMVRKSDVYLDANDAQKKIMEREARAKMGVAPKKAVSIGRVIGALKDIQNISREEKLKIISRIRELSRDAAKDLVQEIRELASGGKITAVQATNIISRFGKVNMLNEISVSNFVDYMSKVFADAEYGNKIEVAKNKLKTAKNNIVTKLGIADGLVLPLQRLFSINPTLIPNAYLDKYLSLVNMFGEKKAVLSLDEKSNVIKDVQEILDEINNEKSLVDELSDRFNNSDNKVFKDDKLDYAASLDKMLKEGDIDSDDIALMKKYKKDIAPQVEKSELTEEEIQAEKDVLVGLLNKATVDSTQLTTRDERNLAKQISSLIKKSGIKELTNIELKNILKVIDNINNGYLPHYAQLVVERLNSIEDAKVLETAINKAKPTSFTYAYSKLKSLITKKDSVLEMIRRNPLFYIDQLFGDFKTKDIFNSVLKKAAEAEAKFTSELKNIQAKLEKAEENIAKSFKLNPNKTLMSKFKMMTYMVQLEYDSNPNNKQVNPASEYLKATIKHIDDGKSQFGERDANMLQEIYDKYTDSEGNIDNKKLYNSFNSAEKEGIKTIREINESLKEKAEYTGAIIRGQKINPLNNYVHLNVLHEHQPNDLASGTSFANDYNNSMRPTTKAKSLIERTGKVSPLNFDVFASAQRGSKFVLMDYHLTEPIRTARKTMNKAISNLESIGRMPKEKRKIANAISNALEETIGNLITNSYTATSIVDDAVDYISRQGYRSVLAGTGRFAAEFISNVGFVIISDPTSFVEGIKNMGVIMSSDAPAIMSNVNSNEINRIFPTDTLSGRMVDTNILSQVSGVKGGQSKNTVANKIQQIFNLSGKKYVNAVELIADILITTPDKAIMRPIWFGSFSENFRKITGKDVDFEKIAANDEAYMEENKDAIEKAKTIADERSVITGASSNAFTGILKGTSKPEQSNTIKAFNNFNGFMSRFLIYEFVTARTGIMAAMGNGSLTKRQGVALLAAVTTRMTVYSLLAKVLGEGIVGLLFDDDDEEEKKAPEKAVGQALVSSFTSMIFGRDFGNSTKTLINYGLERVNENYLDFLREGKYDPYKDALQYSVVPVEKKGSQTDLSDFLFNMGGSFGPALKTTDLAVKKYFEPKKKEFAAVKRQEEEISVRLPLEILGNLGLVPLYKEVRKSVMDDIYKGLKSGGGISREELKKSDPQMYKIMYGKD